MKWISDRRVEFATGAKEAPNGFGKERRRRRDQALVTVVDGNTSPKGLVVIVVVVVVVVVCAFVIVCVGGDDVDGCVPSKSLSKLSIVCFGSTFERGAMSARASASPEAARAKRSYRAISPVNSSFSLMALVNSASSAALEMSSTKRGCIARHCSTSSLANVLGVGGRSAMHPSSTCENTLSEFDAIAMSPFSFSTSSVVYVVDALGWCGGVDRRASSAILSLSRIARCKSPSSADAFGGIALRCGAFTGAALVGARPACAPARVPSASVSASAAAMAALSSAEMSSLTRQSLVSAGRAGSLHVAPDAAGRAASPLATAALASENLYPRIRN